VIDREFTLKGPALLKVSIRSGRVAVEPGGEGTVRFAVDTKDPTFEVRERGDAIVAGGERGGRADVRLSVPQGTELEVATASGEVHVSTTLRRLDVSTSSGDIFVDSVSDLTVRTASGNLKCNRVDGEGRVASSSGDVRIGEIGRRAELSTASGDVTIERCYGSISCSTVSGDMAIAEMSGPSLSLKSMSGTVTIGIRARTQLDLDATSLSGRIRLPSPTANPEPPERDIDARIRLVSGDLRIERVG
jgi:hypothetical protein